MSELVPEVRKDKRGHMVTRWVRKDTPGTAASKKALPKVAAHQSQESKLETRRTRTINRMAKLILLHGYHYDPDRIREELHEFLDKYKDRRSFEVIDAALKADPQSVTSVENIICDYPEDKARAIIHFREHIDPDLREDERDALLAGLRDYPMFEGVKDFASLKGDDHAKAVNLLRVGSVILALDPGVKEQNRGLRWSIEDAMLIDAVLSHPDRIDEMTAFMEERHVFDGKGITDYLNEHSALNKGAL